MWKVNGLSIETNWKIVDLSLFVGGVMMRVGLCLYGPLHLAMGPTARGIFFLFETN